MNEAIQEWLDYVNMDLTVCEQLDAVPVRKQHCVICYHSQQAAEKVLKALLIFFGVCEPLRTHDLVVLLQMLTQYCDVDKNLVEYARVLTPYATNQRYPGGDYVGEVESRIAMKYCREIYDWAMACICELECGNNDSSQIEKI